MKPVKFEDVNCVLQAPGCKELPVLKTEKHIVSCWEMTEMEKEEFARTGRIYLSIMGEAHPPVSLYVDRPYIRQ
ncbi:MAG: hypothetical protein IJX99_06505 [Clostridia bacterium]|nr:hypothetical protein [Clostridia bacterium]